MPKKMRSTRGMAVGHSSMKTHYRQRFNCTFALTNGTTPANFPLTVTGGDRWVQVSDQYQFYRFTKVKLTVHPFFSVVSSAYANDALVVGYMPGAANTAPTAWADIMYMDVVLVQSAASAVARTLSLSKLELLRDAEFPWFKTRQGAAAIELEQQGIFYCANYVVALATPIFCEFTVECEFAGPVYKGLTFTRQPVPEPGIETKTGHDQLDGWQDPSEEAEIILPVKSKPALASHPPLDTMVGVRAGAGALVHARGKPP